MLQETITQLEAGMQLIGNKDHGQLYMNRFWQQYFWGVLRLCYCNQTNSTGTAARQLIHSCSVLVFFFPLLIKAAKVLSLMLI